MSEEMVEIKVKIPKNCYEFLKAFADFVKETPEEVASDLLTGDLQNTNSLVELINPIELTEKYGLNQT